MTATAAPVLPDRLATLCRIVDVGPSTIIGLPDDPDATDRALTAAIAAETVGAPWPRCHPGETTLQAELRRVAKRALAELRHLDAEISALAERRRALADALGIEHHKPRPTR